MLLGGRPVEVPFEVCKDGIKIKFSNKFICKAMQVHAILAIHIII